ncbi:hypothetical protein ALC56_00818 [Trachymyrmex septentrionalis]|uniref:Uncharacterized protein n=1 Tax=Trachymyrmex septentrionalis TaxID=34720 RepID=A0A195FWJ8_9HYME|nr:hypothetical protein ALC56_00818 [Trachymyrmex septentrionalis]
MASLRNDKLSRGEESGERPRGRRWWGRDASHESASRGWRHERRRREQRRRRRIVRSGDCTRNAGRRRGGRSSTQARTRNVKPAQRPRSPASSRCHDASYQRLLNVHFPNSDYTFPLIT